MSRLIISIILLMVVILSTPSSLLAEVTTIQVGERLIGIAFDSHMNEVFVANVGSNTVRDI